MQAENDKDKPLNLAIFSTYNLIQYCPERMLL